MESKLTVIRHYAPNPQAQDELVRGLLARLTPKDDVGSDGGAPDPDALETMKTDEPTNSALVRVNNTLDSAAGQE